MAHEPEAPFETIEGTHQYVTLLGEVLQEAAISIHDDVAAAQADGAARRLEALQLASYKLERLRHHVDASRGLLNDLRTLRRLLLGEREPVLEAVPVRSQKRRTTKLRDSAV